MVNVAIYVIFEIQDLRNSKEPSLRLAVNTCDLNFDDRWQGLNISI